MNQNTEKRNSETYDKVKKAPIDWRQELSKADQQLRDLIVGGTPLNEISVTKLVQLDHSAVVQLQAELDKLENDHQLYTFHHDGVKDTAALIVLVPKITEKTKSIGRLLVTPREYNRFIDEILEEKMMSLCDNSFGLMGKFFPAKDIGFDFSLVKDMLNRELYPSAPENKSRLQRFLDEKNLAIEVVESRTENGLTIRSRSVEDGAAQKPRTPRVVILKTSSIKE